MAFTDRCSVEATCLFTTGEGELGGAFWALTDHSDASLAAAVAWVYAGAVEGNKKTAEKVMENGWEQSIVT